MKYIDKNLAIEIKLLLENARKYVKKTVNTTMVFTYFEIGKLIVEDEQKGKEKAEYGAETLKNLSNELTKEFGRGFSVQNLENMRLFYNVYSKNEIFKSDKIQAKTNKKIDNIKNLHISQKSQTVSRIFTLSWSHYVFLMKLDNREQNFYEKESNINNWSLRELKRQYDSSLYERIVLSREKTKVLEENLKKYHSPEKSNDVIKDPYVLEFLGLEEEAKYSENELEQAIIDKLEHFLLELGKGFSFVGRQKRFTFDEDHFYIDLVFYNRLLKCFVLVDLKIGKLKHQDLGQMQMYVNYYDRFVKTDEESKTIGIVLCKQKNDTLVEITLPENNNIFASKYKLYLPTKEELRDEIEKV